MSKSLFAFALVAQVATTGSVAAQPRAENTYRIDQAPARLAQSVEIADAAIRALQQRLSARLFEEMKRGGPTLAIEVCRDEAQALTAEIARAQGVRVGRTSHQLRNPGNVSPSWAERFVEAGAGKKAASVEAMVVDLGERVGVLRPLPTAAPCVQCHGPAERLSTEVRAFIKTAYPADRAIGFEEGDLRGFIWAEAPVSSTPGPSDVPSGQGAAGVERGKELFAEANPRCTLCHAVAGKGNPQGPPLDGVGKRLGRDEIKAWIRGPVEMAKKRGVRRKPAMLPYPEFSDEELEAMVSYLVSLEPRPRP